METEYDDPEKNEEEPKPVAYGIKNGDGYWCYIYNDKKDAEHVLAKGRPSDKEVIIELYERHQI